MDAAGAPEPSGSRSGLIGLLLGTSPLAASAIAATTRGEWAPLTGVVLLYSWAALVGHLIHVIARWPAGQFRVLPRRAYVYVAGELAFSVMWGWALRMASEGRSLWATPAMLLGLTLIVLCELELAEALHAVDAPHVSDWLYKRRIGRRTVDDLLRFVGINVPGAATPVRRLRRNARRAVGIIIGVFAITFAATAADAGSDIAKDLEPAEPRQSTTGTSTTTTTYSTAIDTGEALPSSTPTTAPPERPKPGFTDVCGVGAVLPGSLAPDWAGQPLFDLYFLPGVGIGAEIAGCPEPTVVISDPFDEVAFQAGFRGDALRSVSVVSRAGRSAVFLGAVAEHMLEMLRDGVAISGFPRFDIGTGDGYVLWSRTGTIVFIRSGKAYGRPGGSYVRVDGDGLREWIRQMDQRRQWLWPRQAADDHDSSRHVVLVDSVGEAVGELRWTTPTIERQSPDRTRLTIDDLVRRHDARSSRPR